METTNLLKEPSVSSSCSHMQRFCFGLGHILNDLCAAIWFSYMLFYFQIILRMDPMTAGTLIMIGQVVDSFATPLAGIALNHTNKRKILYLLGTFAVAIGFSLLFAINPGTDHWWSLFCYVILVALFQTGWAIVQISHLSVIPLISKDHNQSVDLTAIRYIASVCCNIFAYIITWIVLKTNTNAEIGPEDFLKFKEIATIVVIIGFVCSCVFYCGLNFKEYGTGDNSSLESKINELAKKENGIIAPKHFLKTYGIYQVSIMYMTSRLFTIVNLIYIPLYLDEKLMMLNEDNNGIREAVATVPLICFTSSFLTSLLLKNISNFFNDMLVYLIGSIFSLIGCFWISQDITAGFYPQIDTIVVFIGIGGSATMVASLCLTANFVKCNGFKGASIYSTVTFMDKLISGGVVFIIQHLQCESRDLCPNFYRHILTYTCGSAATLGLISLGSLYYCNKFCNKNTSILN